MNNKDMNVMQLEAVAKALDDLLPQVTFVGGCTTALLVDEAAHFGVRETDDVDVIVDVASRLDYHRLSESLRQRGLREDRDGPLCRWLLNGPVGALKLDVMPTDASILGFSNRWYNDAIHAAVPVALPSGMVIRVITPAYFLATKFEAFAGRGKGDYYSHDLEDIVFLLENRNGLLVELLNVSDDMKHYFAQQARGLLNDDFLNVLPGLLNDAAAASTVTRFLKIMSEWDRSCAGGMNT